jgi:uncharacterized protein (TIGR02271 family)
MRDSRERYVTGRDGFTGRLLDSPVHARADQTVRIQLDGGQTIEVPASVLRESEDGSWYVPIGRGDLERSRTATGPATEEAVIPVLAEELVVDRQATPTGGVRVHRLTHEHEETVDLPLLKEHVDIRRVLVDREVDGPLPVRRDGDTTVIPIVEEVLVMQKRFRLKEEIHVTRTVREDRHHERVTLHRQEARVERLDAQGRPVPVDVPVARPERARRSRRKSILAD